MQQWKVRRRHVANSAYKNAYTPLHTSNAQDKNSASALSWFGSPDKKLGVSVGVGLACISQPRDPAASSPG